MPACGVICLHPLELGSSVRLSKAYFEYHAERLVAAIISYVVSSKTRCHWVLGLCLKWHDEENWTLIEILDYEAWRAMQKVKRSSETRFRKRWREFITRVGIFAQLILSQSTQVSSYQPLGQDQLVPMPDAVKAPPEKAELRKLNQRVVLPRDPRLRAESLHSPRLDSRGRSIKPQKHQFNWQFSHGGDTDGWCFRSLHGSDNRPVNEGSVNWRIVASKAVNPNDPNLNSLTKK